MKIDTLMVRPVNVPDSSGWLADRQLRHISGGPPRGWPSGRQRFPVQGVTIVGVEPMLVERVAGRLTWGRVLATGAFLGLFAGLLLSLLRTGAGASPILFGLDTGVAFGMALAAFRYRSANGPRDFVSHSQLVARRFDVLCLPRNAERPQAPGDTRAEGVPGELTPRVSHSVRIPQGWISVPSLGDSRHEQAS